MSIINDEIAYTTKNTINKQKLIQAGFTLNSNNKFIIKPSDLYKIFPGSPNIYLNCICDHCNTNFSITCKKLTRSQGKSKAKLEQKEYQDNLILCKKCRLQYTSQYRYNTNSPNQATAIINKKCKIYNNKTLEEKRIIINKQIITKQNKSLMEKQQIRIKTMQTNLERYGAIAPAQNNDIKEKIKKTNLQKYGVEYVTQSKLIQEKMKQTNLKRYGVKNAMQTIKIQAKARQTMYKNNNVPTSIQQQYFYNILKEYEVNKKNIILNYPFNHLSLDIALINEKIDIEYNGGGHNLDVKLQGYSQEEFEQREIKRNKFIKSQGWKQIFIIALHDKIKNYIAKDYIKIIYIAKQYLINTNHHWVKIYIEENKFETSIYTQTITNILNL